MSSISITPIPILSDNYVWCISKGSQAWLLDPGRSEPVIDHLAEHQLSLAGILVTHAHWDHVTGIPGLIHHKKVPVLGPSGAAIPYQTHLIKHNDSFDVLGKQFKAIHTPGHTRDHMCYFSDSVEPPMLFSGDTLFSLGCGRMFDGNPSQFSDSLAKLASLPPETRVYCTHEYTLSNAKFALALEPNNEQLVDKLEELGSSAPVRCSLPSTIEQELNCNPFLRCNDGNIINALLSNGKLAPDAQKFAPVEVFTALRSWKDIFTG